MSVKDYPSIEFVRQCLRYEDGKLFWLARPRDHFPDQRSFSTWNARFAGKEAGCSFTCGRKGRRESRWQVRLYEKPFLRSLVVWALHTGEWQLGIDHEDRNPLNDRIENLRLASQSQNMANATMRSDNTSGFKGVTWDKANHKWSVMIHVGGRHIRVGRFSDPAEAHAAYMKAAREHFGDFACDGT
jgi:hypothetical protein